MGKRLFIIGSLGLVAAIAIGAAWNLSGKGTLKAVTPPVRAVQSATKGTAGARNAVGAQHSRADAMSFQILTSYTAREIKNEYLPSTAHGIYLIVRIGATNKTAQPLVLESSQVKLELDGAQYSADAGALSALELSGRKGLSTAELGPAGTATGWVVFDISRHAAVASPKLCLVGC